jgi:hypothetical protein
METNTRRPTRGLGRLVALVALASMLQGCMTMRVANPMSAADGKSRNVRVTWADQNSQWLYNATVTNDSVIGYQHVPRGTPLRVGVPLGEVQRFEVEQMDGGRTAAVIVVSSTALVYLIGSLLRSKLRLSTP